jgi:predicted MFS family arabinose efflux permease
MLLASLPVIADLRFDADARIAGMFFGAWGAGALVGTFGVMGLLQKLPPMRIGALAAVALAAPLWLLPLSLSAWGLALVLFVSGVFTPMLNAPLITLIMLRTPPDIRPQTITFVMTASLLASPIGFAVTGPIIEHRGVSAVMWLVAAGCSVAALVLLSLIKAPVSVPEPEMGT